MIVNKPNQHFLVLNTTAFAAANNDCAKLKTQAKVPSSADRSAAGSAASHSMRGSHAAGAVPQKFVGAVSPPIFATSGFAS